VEKDIPFTSGTTDPPPKQPDQVMATRVPAGIGVPGGSGRAPTATLGPLPAMDSDATTLWLATVPLSQAAFKGTIGNPALCSALCAGVILRPMTLGTSTLGCVVVVVVVVGTVDVDVDVVGVLLDVAMERTAAL